MNSSLQRNSDEDSEPENGSVDSVPSFKSEAEKGNDILRLDQARATALDDLNKILSEKEARRNELRGFLKQSQETTCEINNEVGVRAKCSSQSRLEHNDKLVKYMSKLPGYLQRMERNEESVQSNVLNVGVLDWGRLEKWKIRRATESGKQCVDKLDGEEKIIGEFSNIVLLRSRKQSQSSTLSGEPQLSLDDDNMRVARSQIPRSCPISFDL